MYSKGEWFIPKGLPAMAVTDSEVIKVKIPEERARTAANDDKMNIYSLLNLQIPGFEKLKQNIK